MQAMQRYSHVLSGGLILLSFVLLVSEHLFHYPVAIMAVWGCVLFVRQPRRWLQTPGASATLVMFLCIWVPMLAALPDAENFHHSAKTVLLYLHFLPAAYFIVEAASDARVRRFVFFGIVGLVVFLSIDALIQLALGRDIFGYPNDSATLKGAFYPKQRLGLILAVFAPLYFEAVRLVMAKWQWSWLVLVPILIVIMLSLKRTAWIMLAVACAGFGWCLWQQSTRFNPRKLVLPVIALAVTALVVFSLSSGFSGRVDVTAGLFQADVAAIDKATSHRVSLWLTGGEIFRHHWFNGVGPRGYRHAYRRYAEADDFWLRRGSHGQTHPHLMLMEVMVEAGVIGLFGYVVFWVVLLRALYRSVADSGEAVPWLLAVVVAWFPLNAHLAFYGSYWSTLVWLLLPLGLCGYSTDRRCPEPGAVNHSR